MATADSPSQTSSPPSCCLSASWRLRSADPCDSDVAAPRPRLARCSSVTPGSAQLQEFTMTWLWWGIDPKWWQNPVELWLFPKFQTTPLWDTLGAAAWILGHDFERTNPRNLEVWCKPFALRKLNKFQKHWDSGCVPSFFILHSPPTDCHPKLTFISPQLASERLAES